MAIRQYRIYRYRIPMDSQVVLRQRFLKQREGLLVWIRCHDREGWGEIAPLPEWSEETLPQATEQAISWLSRWNQARSIQQKLDYTGLFPSVAFGISCAMAEMQGELQSQGNYQTVPLCYGDPDALYSELDAMQGEKVAKIKVGLYEANRDGLIVDMLLDAIPDLQLRLDANRSWTLEKALLFAKYIRPEYRSRIQFIEEPCQNPQLSRQFANQTKIAIAWDETVRENMFTAIQEPLVKAIVIKPTLTGSLPKCLRLIEQAQQQGLQAVISSSIESSFGLTQLARIATQYTPHTLPGLDTLDLMQQQVVRSWPGSVLPVVALNTDQVELIHSYR